MKNKAPIFLNCFTQGGSNILWNMVVSHPDVCSPAYEFHGCINTGYNTGMMKKKKLFKRIPIDAAGVGFLILTGKMKYFDVRCTNPRQPLSPLGMKYVFAILERCKRNILEMKHDFRMKNPDTIYLPEELAATRLCIKSNNGLIFINPEIKKHLPNTQIIHLVRHPIALYESWHRRKHVKSPEEFAALFNSIAQTMIDQTSQWGGLCLRYEDMVSTPSTFLSEVYQHLGLELNNDFLIRLKSKPHRQSDGSYGNAFDEGQHHWFPTSQLHKMIQPNVNTLQAQAISKSESSKVYYLTREICEHFNYKEKTA